jgi:hypothetical protein
MRLLSSRRASMPTNLCPESAPVFVHLLTTMKGIIAKARARATRERPVSG